LATLVEELSVNVSLGLLSVNGLVQLQAQQNVPVVASSTQIVFQYNKRALLTTYGVAILAGTMALIIGSLALYENGVAMSGGFLAVLRTTRDVTLDDVVPIGDRGADPVPQELENVCIKFGDSRRQGGNEGRLHEANSHLQRRHLFGFSVENLR
jgi:hypothetical protein